MPSAAALRKHQELGRFSAEPGRWPGCHFNVKPVAYMEVTLQSGERGRLQTCTLPFTETIMRDQHHGQREQGFQPGSLRDRGCIGHRGMPEHTAAAGVPRQVRPASSPRAQPPRPGSFPSWGKWLISSAKSLLPHGLPDCLNS